MKKLDITSFAEALKTATKAATPTSKKETIKANKAVGRILAQDIICRKNLPSFDNSAMDGFAFRYEDRGKKLKIAASIFAGDKPTPLLKEQECYRIMTGAQVPMDADTIVPIEDCLDVGKDYVVVGENIKRGNAVRKKGEEQKSGALLMCSGEVLDFSRIAMLSAQGITDVEVFVPLKIAVLSTGNEIVEPWQEANDDQIYNANALGITALLAQYGFEADYKGSLSDNLQETIDAIGRLKSYDVIITTGGISMGEADFLEEAFVANGLKRLFHGVNVKPGRPTMMGVMDGTFVMAMPGNPLTTLLNILMLSIVVLRKLQGATHPYHTKIKTKISQDLKLKPSRTNLVLGRIEKGIFQVIRDNKIGSGMLTPLMESNAVAICSEDISELKEGDEVEVVVF